MTEPFFDTAYVRHRPRMVRQSVFEDLRDTLIVDKWLAGTTRDTATTTAANQTLGLLDGAPINLIDYFPESDGPVETPLNTFAMDIGEQGAMESAEMGGMFQQGYTFNFAFYANSDAVAQALMSDLHDRYMGVRDSPFITLYNYVTTEPTAVVRMEVESFRHARDLQNIAPHEAHLYFAELEITDYIYPSPRA